MNRCLNLRDWESRRLLDLAAGETAVLVRPVDARVPYVWEDRRCMPWPYDTTWSHGDDGEPWMPCPFGRPGDTLIGREAWVLFDFCVPMYLYRADWINDTPPKWRSAAIMPAWAARHRLTIGSVEVKRCTGTTLHDLLHALDVPNEHRFRIRKEWPEKRFHWATSHAWVLRCAS